MRRREFLGALGGAAATWPLAAHAQQPDRARRIGVLYIFGPDDPEAKARHAVFEQTLSQLGWTPGRDLLIDGRFADGDAARLRR
jgi:putative ABC transport system substrate-binding protein